MFFEEKMIGLVELVSIVFTIFFTLVFIYVLIPNMKKEKNFWDDYFKQVDIYQGRSHWTKLREILTKKG